MPAARLPANFPLTGRGPVVIAVIHGPDCPQCVAWIDGLERGIPAIQEWGGRIMVALHAHAESSAQLPIAGPRVVIADEWGEVFFQSKNAHDFPDLQEVTEWVRFIAIQCPECEQPEGEWRNL